jgi:hypothetical protein
MRKLIISISDFSGAWSQPYVDADTEYHVVRVDPKLITGRYLKRAHSTVGMTAGQFLYSDQLRQLLDVYGAAHGVLLAPPCTHFAGSGARWWADKDADGRTTEACAMINDCLDIVAKCAPEWWALENPVGRLPSLFPNLLGKAKMFFHPCDHGDAYTKRTGLWGDFTTFGPSDPVEPVMYTDKNGKRGSWHWAKLGGKSERTKALRSNTPAGFARAFFNANQ